MKTLFNSKKEYINYFQQVLEKDQKEKQKLFDFLNNHSERLDQLTKNISQDTFWQVLPELLGIDAKLTLLIELIHFEDFSEEEILRIIEMDYQNYFKELCGFDLRSKPKHSMIFNIK